VVDGRDLPGEALGVDGADMVPASISASRIVAANAGVPIKTRSSASLGAGRSSFDHREAGSGRTGTRLALCLGKLAQDHSRFTSERWSTKGYIEVLDLVLQEVARSPRRASRDLVLVVEIAQPDRGRR